MLKEFWKWFIKDFTDKEIIQIINRVNEHAIANKTKKIEVKGISDFNKLKLAQISLFRSRIETELNKTINTNKLKKILKLDMKKISNLKQIEDLSKMEYDIVAKDIETIEKEDMKNLILYLITHVDQTEIDKGLNLFELYKSKTEQTEIEKNEELDDVDFEDDWANEKEKLLAEISDLKQKLNFEKNVKGSLMESNKALEKSLLTTKRDNTEYSKELKKIKNDLSDKKYSVYTLEQKNKELENSLALLKQQLDISMAQIKDLEQESVRVSEELVKIKSKKVVHFVGNYFPNSIEVPEVIDLQLVQPSEISILERETVIFEIWFIQFRLPIREQKLLISNFGIKAKGFKGEKELKQHVNSFVLGGI
ncbi:hypothetical protein [Paenibacillus xylanexedens]|uniref:hypothetical protein n=1 Tax=Paenibacillus xylanexedens TaxID=528191 RepID=UPI003B019D4D